MEAIAKLIPKDPLVERIKEEQKFDALCQQVIQYCKQGWPTYKSDSDRVLHAFWEVQGHLTVVDGLLLYDNRVVIPTSLRVEMLGRIHEAHQGIEKC